MEQMEQIDGFMFFRSYYEAIRQLPNPADRCALYDAVCDYAFRREKPEFTGITQAMWQLLLPTLQRSIKRAQAARMRKLAQEASKSVANREQTGSKTVANREQSVTEEKEEEKEKEKEKKKVEVEEGGKLEIPTREENKGKGEFHSASKVNLISPSGNDPLARPPKKEQILEYCRSHGLSVDPQRFFNYYEARGWQLPTGPVRNWQACLESWEGNKYSNPPAKSPKTMNQQQYTLGEDELYAIEKMKRMASSS